LAKTRRTTGSGRRRLRLIAVGVCLCSAISGASIAAFSGAHTKSGDASVGIGSPPRGLDRAAPAATARSAGRAPAAPKTTPALLSHGLTTAALRVPSELKYQVWRWKVGPGGAALSAVTQQMDAAAQSAGLRVYVQMKLACIGLDASIRRAQAAPPIPDAAMQHLYGRALARLYRAAGYCQQAISEKQEDVEDMAIHVDETLLNRSRSEFAVAFEKLYDATAAIAALVGRR
jgi:hypothetical protein